MVIYWFLLFDTVAICVVCDLCSKVLRFIASCLLFQHVEKYSVMFLSTVVNCYSPFKLRLN